MNRDEFWRPQSESLRWRSRAEPVIAGGAQTLSKAPASGVFHVCARHSASDVQAALEAFDAACAGLAEHDDVGVLLVGEPVAPAVRPFLS